MLLCYCDQGVLFQSHEQFGYDCPPLTRLPKIIQCTEYANLILKIKIIISRNFVHSTHAKLLQFERLLIPTQYKADSVALHCNLFPLMTWRHWYTITAHSGCSTITAVNDCSIKSLSCSKQRIHVLESREPYLGLLLLWNRNVIHTQVNYPLSS